MWACADSVRRAKMNAPSWRLLLTAIFVSLGTTFHFGFHVSVTNTSEKVFKDFMNETLKTRYNWRLNSETILANNLWSAVLAIFFIGAICGSLCLRFVADCFGRKRGLMLMLAVKIFGCLLSILSHMIDLFELFLISRFILGAVVAISTCLAGIYLTECSPKRSRGSVSMLLGVVLQFGVFVGVILGMNDVLGTATLWWLIFALELVLILIVLGVLNYTHESPCFLLLRGNEKAARNAICFFYDYESDGERLEMTFREIQEDVRLKQKSLGMLELWRIGSSYDRKGALMGCVLGMAIIFSGITAVMTFSKHIFVKAKFKDESASVISVGVMCASLISCIVSTFLIDKCGRRRTLFVAYSLILVINIIISALLEIVQKDESLAWSLVPAFVIFTVIFSMGPGPLSLFITSEILSQNARSAGQSWSFLVQMACRSIMILLYPLLEKASGPGWAFLLLFTAPIMFTILMIHFRLPETKNRNIREIHCEFDKLPKISSISSKLPKLSKQELIL